MNEEKKIGIAQTANGIKQYVRRSIFWVFSHYINEIPVFERSTPYEDRAKERIKELKDWYGYTEAFYSTELPKKYFA